MSIANHILSSARASRNLASIASRSAPLSAARAATNAIRPETAGRGRRVDHANPLAALAVALERSAAWRADSHGAGKARRDVDRDDILAGGQQRLVSLREVAH